MYPKTTIIHLFRCHVQTKTKGALNLYFEILPRSAQKQPFMYSISIKVEKQENEYKKKEEMLCLFIYTPFQAAVIA